MDGSVVRIVAVAGIAMAVVGRSLGSLTARVAAAPDPWQDIWYENALDDDDREPDAETLEAHARRMVARRALARP